MKKLITISLCILLSLLTTNCGTIIGGARYNAHVEVKGHPDASIYYDGKVVGVGKATFLHKRNKANKLSITLKKEGCKEYTHVRF